VNHTELGAMGEAYVARLLTGAGLAVQYGGPADLLIEGVPVEVKAARFVPYKRGRNGYQFCLHRDGRRGVQAAAVVLLCYWDAASDPVAFVIPAQDVGQRRKVVIPGQPWLYSGRWARWYSRWEALARDIQEEV